MAFNKLLVLLLAFVLMSSTLASPHGVVKDITDYLFGGSSLVQHRNPPRLLVPIEECDPLCPQGSICSDGMLF